MELALFDFLRGRMQRGKKIKRTGIVREPGMSFLAPLFLLGALAVALPIVFHLIRRTSREKMPFSS